MGVNRRHKDSVFSLLFSDPGTLRELYGAIAGVELPPDAPVAINTLEDVLYKTLLNDISFEVAHKLVILIEHQSTINPNMAFRLLLYIARVYEKITAGRNMYGSKKLFIPRPEFIVLYNGTAPYPDKAEMRLSDSFEDAAFPGTAREAVPRLELVVKVYNINAGHNEEIVRRCGRLRGYSVFIAKVREYGAAGRDKEAAMREAIRYCMEHGILKEFLTENGAEVVNMLLTEWKLEDALVVEREEGREEGLEETAKKALAKGFSADIVSDITGLDIDTVTRLSQK
jgi:hypothetical protein